MLQYNLPIGEGETSTASNVIALDWYDGMMGYEDVEQVLQYINCHMMAFVEVLQATLAVVYENGHAQILQKETDTHPVVINASMTVRCAKWNPQGTILALCGTKYELRNLMDVTIHMFKFFNAKGDVGRFDDYFHYCYLNFLMVFCCSIFVLWLFLALALQRFPGTAMEPSWR